MGEVPLRSADTKLVDHEKPPKAQVGGDGMDGKKVAGKTLCGRRIDHRSLPEMKRTGTASIRSVIAFTPGERPWRSEVPATRTRMESATPAAVADELVRRRRARFHKEDIGEPLRKTNCWGGLRRSKYLPGSRL